ncbi:MAG TPA: M57 family metalloprotease, partial [Thermoanaerobaculia bacterium]
MKQIRLLTAVAFLVASAASATVFQPTSDRQLVDRSEAVVVATVRDAVSRVRADGYVVTDYRFDVEQTLKGTAAGSITVSEIGGVAGTRFTYISDSAAYTPGERVLVFLRKRGDGTYFTTSMAMGKFSFTRNAAGEAVVTRDVSELPGDPARMADTFSRFVRDSAQGNANNETYTAKLTPIANALHPHPLDLAPASAYCLSFGQPLRWPGGESGTVHFFVTGTMPNVPNAATNIANGLAAWTNDPNAGIVLAGGNAPPGGTSATPAFDGLNVIYLNQTPPGNGLCDQTFFCTVDSGHTEDTHTFHGETFISIEDADIVMGGSAGPTEFETLITHELGHAIGFRHSDDSQHYPPPYSFSAIMTSAVNPAFGSNLQQYDRDAVDTVYGNGPPCIAPTSVSISGGGAIPSGQTATLTATVTGGNGTFTYAWFDGSLNDTSNPVGTNSPTFTTPPVTGTKNYWVRVTNACGNVTAATSVFVQETTCRAPIITGQPSSQTINSHSTATLSV